MKRVIELIRVSTESQAAKDKASIPSQRAINRRTATAFGLTIARSIEISDVGGAVVLQAPEIQELLILIGDPEVHGVVTTHFSRLIRLEDLGDLSMLQVFVNSNTVLYLPDGPIDFSTKTGRLIGPLRALMAGMERTDILERMWNIKEQKRREGGFAQSKVCLPFGVDFEDGWRYTPKAEQVREAFGLVLAGNTSYVSVGQKVGIEPYNLRNILRNTIYTGVRTIDKRRDPSAAGKYATKDGRQGDRRKIKRAPEDVIRVKVLEPIVSESDFNQVQRILDLKRSHHWRTKEGYESRFTYRGFLICSTCQSLVYTKFRRADYYVCKSRHIGHTCPTGYMRREVIEPYLDSLFADKLTSIQYLKQIERTFKKPRPQASTEVLTAQIKSLEGKRQRILNTFFDGHLSSEERDLRLAEIAREQRAVSKILDRQRPSRDLNAQTLAKVFSTFVRFKRLSPNQKRGLLNAIAPEILVANYQVAGLTFSTGTNHTGTGSWRLPA